MHPFNADKRGRSRAARSRRVVLSRPSSLQGPSDIPPPVARLLPVSSDLRLSLPPPKHGGGGRTSGPRLRTLSSACRWPYPGFPAGACALFSSLPALAFPKTVVGRRVARSLGFIPLPDSLSNDRPGLSDEAAPFALCYGLRIRLAPRAEYDSRLLRRSPSRHHVGASSAELLPTRPAPSLHTQKGQLVWQSPFRLLDYGLETSYTVKISGGSTNFEDHRTIQNYCACPIRPLDCLVMSRLLWYGFLYMS